MATRLTTHPTAAMVVDVLRHAASVARLDEAA